MDKERFFVFAFILGNNPDWRSRLLVQSEGVRKFDFTNYSPRPPRSLAPTVFVGGNGPFGSQSKLFRGFFVQQAGLVM
jgi:hypothetical protein